MHGSKPTTSTTSTQSSPSKNNYTNSKPSVRPSPRSTNTASENPAISYTPEAWRARVDHATIHPGGTNAIAFNDG